eukprot:5874842-Amphidinium_carterae.1
MDHRDTCHRPHLDEISGDLGLGACTEGRASEARVCGQCPCDGWHNMCTGATNSEFISRFATSPVSPQLARRAFPFDYGCDALSAVSPLTFDLMAGLSSTLWPDGAVHDRQSCHMRFSNSTSGVQPSPADQTPAQPICTLPQPRDIVHTLSMITLNVLSLAGGEEHQNDAGGAEHPSNQVPTLCRTGQLTFLCEKLEKDQVSIACLQETRLSLPEGFSMRTFEIIQNPARNGCGGLIIAVSKQQDHEVLSHKCVGARVLTATIRIHGMLVFVMCAHAPIRKAALEEHAQFAQDVEDAARDRPINALFLGGADLNARVAKQESDITISGPLASKCPHDAVHARSLMKVLQRRQLHMLNTFLDSNGLWDDATRNEPVTSETIQKTITTWRHPQTKREFQIDYILACPQALKCVSACGTVEWAHYDLLTQSDHRAVRATFVLGGPKKMKRSKRRVTSHTSETHLRAFSDRMASAMRSYQPAQDKTPFAVVRNLQEIAMTNLAATKPRGAQPKSAWISDSTWALMRSLNALRKIQKDRQHGSTAVSRWLLPITVVKMPGFDDESFPRILTLDGLVQWTTEDLVGYIRSLTKFVRNALRREKRLWTDTQCNALGDHVYARQTREAFQLVKKLAKHKGYTSKGALAMDDGTITRDKSALHALWTAHWTEHFGSSIEQGHSFDNIELMGYDQPFSMAPSLGSAVDAPACGFTTANEVRSIMATFNVNRSAPDVCPLRYWRMLEPWMSCALAQEYNACLQQGHIPNSWSGSLLVPICKKSKTPYAPESHRPTQLMLTEAK